MRKWMAACLATLTGLCLLLSACSGGGDDTSKPASGTGTGVAETTADSGETQATDEGGATGDATATGNGTAAPGTKAPNGPGRTDAPGKVTAVTKGGGGSGTTKPVPVTLKNNCYSAGFPIAKSTAKLTVMIKDYTGLTNYSAMKLNDYLKSKMNIRVDWIVVPGGGEREKMTLAYTSGNLPDIFMGMAPTGGYDFHWKYIKDDKAVLALDSYLGTYAPNIQQVFKDVPEAKYQCTADDGKTYMLPMINDSRDPFIYERLFINQTWLDNLGMDMPTTTEEFRKVLQAFKNNDPNNNKIDDEIPLLLGPSMTGPLPGCLYGPFGLSVYGGNVGYQITDSRKVQLNMVSDDYKKALIYYRNLYQDKLIDKDWFSNTRETVSRKLNSKTVIVGAFVAESGVNAVGADRMNKDYAMVPPLKGPDGKRTWSATNVEHIWPEWFLVTKACKTPEIAVRFADYFYSLEGTLTALQGPPGYNWEEKQGKPVMTDNYYASKYVTAELTPGYPLVNYQSDAYLKLVEIPAAKRNKEQKARYAEEEQAKKLYGAVAPKNPTLSLKYTAEERQYLEKETNGAAAYWARLLNEFLANSTNIETYWDNYIASCNALGAKEQTKTMQKALDRYYDFLKQN